MYSKNDYRDYLEHSWGKKPEQKAREAEYNHSYYQTHKDKWKEYAKNAATGLANKFAENAEAIAEDMADRLVDAADVMVDVIDILGGKQADAYHDAKWEYESRLGSRDFHYVKGYQGDMKRSQNESDPDLKDFYKRTAKMSLSMAPSAGETRAAADRMRKAYNEYKDTPLGILDAAFEKAGERMEKRFKERGW